MEQKYIISKEQYLAVKAKWAVNYSGKSAWEHIIYNLLRSKPANHGFCEKTKNIQGNNPWYAFNEARHHAQWNVRGWDSKKFEERFGCAMPEGFQELLKAQVA